MFTIPPSVLLIDDELPICTGVCGLLQMTGFNAEFVTSASEGYEYLRQNQHPDIILLDVNLGKGESGLDALQEIKKINKYLQVVMFTSQDSLEIGLESMKRGAIDFLSKPFDLKLFTKIAAVALERKKIEQIKDLYFDMVLHDLKNPLQVIGGAFEMLSVSFDGRLSPIQQKVFDVAEAGVKQLQMVIGNVIGITNFEKKSLKARHEQFSIYELLSKDMALFDNLEILYNNNFDSICTDKDLFLRVVTNLVSNACRFANPGTNVIVKIEPDVNADIRVSVENTGSFIPPEMRSQVFDKFLSVHTTSNCVRGQNFGLGLTFSKFAVDAIGGKIWIEGDEEKQLTRFVFTVNDTTCEPEKTFVLDVAALAN
jgi:two-component system, sensor histidine kinase and response regulator